MPNLSRIKYANGGETPDILKGLYTGYTMANKAIKAYEQLKPIHEAQVYAHQKTITDAEEEKAFEKIKEEVQLANQANEAEDVKAEKPTGKHKSRAERIREGSDNGSKSANVS